MKKKQFFKKFEKKTVLNNHMRNVIPKFQSCRWNGVATIAKTYTHLRRLVVGYPVYLHAFACRIPDICTFYGFFSRGFYIIFCFNNFRVNMEDILSQGTRKSVTDMSALNYDVIYPVFKVYECHLSQDEEINLCMWSMMISDDAMRSEV